MPFSYFDTRSPVGWRDWTRVNTDVTDDGVVIARGVAPVTIPGATNVVDVAVDDCGDVHALDATGTLYQYDPATDAMVQVACLGTEGVGTPRALCIGENSVYIADAADSRVRSYSRVLRQLRWESAPQFADIVGMVHDGTGPLVLTSDSDPEGARLVRLAPDGTMAAVVAELRAPIDLSVDQAGNLYVLDVDDTDDGSMVLTILPVDQSTTGETATSTAAVHSLADPIADASCIAALNVDELLIAVDGDTAGETAVYRCRFREPDVTAIDRFERRCTMLATGTGGPHNGVETTYGVGGERDTSEVYRLDGSRKVRRNERTGRYDAQLRTRLDSGERGTTWHRVTMDIDDTARDTQVRVRYCATEDEEQFADSPELERIDGIGKRYAARLRDAGVTYLREMAAEDSESLADEIGVSTTNTTQWIDQARERLVGWHSLDEPNPTDALLPAATGRYLWIELSLIGNEYTTPKIRCIRTYFPRQSYLRHLPAVYREDEASEAFLERFLSLFESQLTDVEEAMARVTQYMDPEGIPIEDLAWLGDWLALELDETWPEAARRELVERGPELAGRRGTPDGLLALLRIYLHHTQPGSSWRDALDADGDALVELVKDRPLTDAEARTALGEHDALRSSSGEVVLRHMVVAWSEALDRRCALLKAMVTARLIADDDREDYEATDLIYESDEGSLRYLVEYATVLDEVIAKVEQDAIELDAVVELLERYERRIRDAANRSGPLLLEGRDLDCIDEEEALAQYDRIVDHSRGFSVLARPGVEGERMRMVRRTVTEEQPAYAAGTAVRLRPWFRLGGHAYLGINSGLYGRELALDRATLGEDSVLGTREPYGQLGVKSRLGIDCFLT